MNSHGSERGGGDPRSPDGRIRASVAPRGTAPDGSAPVLQDDNPFEVLVPTPSDGEIVVDIRARRADVVHRLLGLGVSHCTLMALLPEWSELIAGAASEHLEAR